jgi:hypothetical protein
MAWTQSDVDALKAALALGATRVRFADRDVTYRSLAEMKAILRDMEEEVAVANGTTRPRIRQYRFVTSKGLR